MNFLRKRETQGRCGWFKTWPNGRGHRNERRATSRPALESLENRELLSATGLDPVPMQASLPNVGQVSPAHQTTISPSADVSVPGNNTVRSAVTVTPSDSPPGGFTPAQLRQAYGFDQIYFNNGTIRGDGSGQTIAIVDAYDDPNIYGDLNTFDQAYGLTSSSPSLYQQYGAASSFLKVVNEDGGPRLPTTDPTGGWEVEEALDVEWAHAIAPGANILLVEADSASSGDMLTAARMAATQRGVSVVSLSWTFNTSGEAGNDSGFITPYPHPGVTFVAAAGDQGMFKYPASSPNVLAVGGTNLSLNSLGNYQSETVWNDASGSSGGGQDPKYSSANFYPKSGPDVAYNAVGFSLYDSYKNSGWIVRNGTSGGTPQWAALIAIANQGRALDGKGSLDGASQTLHMLDNLPSSDFHTDIFGSNQNGAWGSAVNGLGTPYADRVVSGLSGQPISSPPPTQQPPIGQPPLRQPTPQPIAPPKLSQPPAPQPPAAPNPFNEVAADALFLARNYESGNMGAVYLAVMDFESIMSHSPASLQQPLEQAFIDDIFADVF